MTKLKQIVFFIFLGLSITTVAFAEIVDKIVVVVNDEVITQREIDRKMFPVAQQLRTQYDETSYNEKIKEAYTYIIEQIIRDKLVLSEARRRGVEVSEGEIQGQVDDVKTKFESEEEFYLALENQGISLKELKDNYGASLMAKKLMDIEVGAKISIVPAEICGYYEEHKEQFTMPSSAKVRTVLVKITADRNSEAALALAKEAQVKLRNGADFSEVAKEYSDSLSAAQGGDMGYVKEGEMIKRIDDAVFSLKKGETSDIVRTDLGYHIFKVEDLKESRQYTFEEVSDRIEKFIFKTKFEERFEDFMKQLEENAYIEFK